ncbi:phosphate ABC transporter substrate-binding protein [Halomonas koreensis]|uniref:Phosphate ABC transporter substrate-binding protein n=2 Tax=Halomonas koreensis TaxID=245385 RepID=A0ABU1G0S2_9GAMM|nr:phosphate ABC transporter substrate-binding protein [Halomonas koreensis]MDR5866511.1 phosphate ABC transporter substrate-binding protein [Halomonas koreensis]
MAAMRRGWLIGLMLLLVAPGAAPALADHGVGTLDTVGSDTMAGLMLRWGERLGREHPGLRVQLQASGSASAPPALTAGTTLVGPMSRPMTEAERAAFVARYGYPPRDIVVARDALVVVAHRHNPLSALSRAELDAIFSESRRCGAPRGIRRWQALALARPSGRIALHGRNAVSGTHGLFRREALCGGSFRPEVNEHPGSAAVVAAVADDPRALGYAGLNHLTPGVKALALRDAEGRLRRPEPAAVRRGAYPLARDLHLYVNRPPDGDLPAAERAFLSLVLSAEGQAIVEELGFVSLPAEALAAQRRRLGLPSAGD